MTDRITAPYGSWKSPITSALIVSKSIYVGAISLFGEDIYWLELRPQEEGRLVLVQRKPDGQARDVTPPPFNVRTRVHEYGGGAYIIVGETIYFSNFSDQRVYCLAPVSAPTPHTPEGDYRYADYHFDKFRNRLICVREDHTQSDQEAVNTIVSLAIEQKTDDLSAGELLVSGNNFYSNPRLSPDGTQLTWLSWSHPNLPWDGTELWLADVSDDGSLHNQRMIAGGSEISIFQPSWSPDGTLYFVSDQTGWWNLYRLKDGIVESLYETEAEFGAPQWSFGTSTYGFQNSDRIICTFIKDGNTHLTRLDIKHKTLDEIPVPHSDIWGIKVDQHKACFMAGSPTENPSLISLDLNSNRTQVMKQTSEIIIDRGYLSTPETVEFPTDNGLNAFAFFYPPANKDYQALPGELPPLLVMSHGGPTGATSNTLSLEVQYWTSRGIAVLDVNYGGSTGYGRAYRLRLNGKWGVVDMHDCSNGALFMANLGRVDKTRLAITGGSAGGYTTLCALTFTDTFKAGASHFGIGDLVTFVQDTHKFESRYLDRLVGPYPASHDLYLERSPIYHTDQLNCPIILLQGLEDKIVPPSQAETMYAAVKAKGLPVAYLPFEGEQHGFRKAENIKRALDAELYFYSRVFGFPLAEPIEPIAIDNLSAPT